MKEKIHFVIEAVLAIAVIILFIFHFSGNKGASIKNEAPEENSNSVEKTLPMAYIDVDSLMSNYTYSIDLNEQIMKKYENSRANLTTKLRRLQNDATNFQRKIETNAFLSRERAEAEQKRIMKRQEDLQKLEVELSQELAEEQLRMNEELRKDIILHLHKYNEDKGFQIVYGKINDNILYADEAYNITGEVINYLNKQRATPSPIIQAEEEE